jgi:hypothetical protein
VVALDGCKPTAQNDRERKRSLGWLYDQRLDFYLHPQADGVTINKSLKRGTPMLVKLLLTYNVNDGASEEHQQFVAGEFLPAVQKMGLAVTEVWYTVYGDYPERQTELVSRDEDTLWRVLSSDEWNELEERLQEYVNNFGRKVVEYQPGFQM